MQSALRTTRRSAQPSNFGEPSTGRVLRRHASHGLWLRSTFTACCDLPNFHPQMVVQEAVVRIGGPTRIVWRRRYLAFDTSVGMSASAAAGGGNCGGCCGVGPVERDVEEDDAEEDADDCTSASATGSQSSARCYIVSVDKRVWPIQTRNFSAFANQSITQKFDQIRTIKRTLKALKMIWFGRC